LYIEPILEDIFIMAAPCPYRVLHTMLRVRNLAASIDFYVERLGMNLLRREQHDEGRYTIAFLGFASEARSSVIELTENWDIRQYEPGSAFGHLAFGVEDVYVTCDYLAASNVPVTRAPGPRSGSNEHIAFIRDPDGYAIELIQLTPVRI